MSTVLTFSYEIEGQSKVTAQNFPQCHSSKLQHSLCVKKVPWHEVLSDLEG